LQSRLLALLAVLSFAACTVGNSTKPVVHSNTTDVGYARNMASLTQKGADAMKLVAEKNWPQAQIALQAVIEDKNFRNLPEDIQFQTLQLAGQVAVEHGQVKRGYDYFVRVTSFPQAGYKDWRNRLVVADGVGNLADIVRSLTLIVQRWPDHTAELGPDNISRTIREAKKLPHGAALPLLLALYDAHWKLKWDIEPSESWRDLTLLLLEKGRLTQANDVVTHVTDVYVLIAMRVDRRFDAVVAANPAQFDIEASAEREFLSFQSAAEKTPYSLELKLRVIRALLSQQHYDAALAASDSILMDIRSTNFPTKLYEDYDERRPWFLVLRDIALERVGRWDDAVAQLSEGSNGNQLLDLAQLYCDLGRPRDALSTIDRVGARATTVGTMRIELVRLEAAFQLGDSKQVARSMEYLRVHRPDNPSDYLSALLFVNQLDRASHELVTQLLDEDGRQEALLSVQSFAPTRRTPRDMDLDARWHGVIAQSNVQAAIQKVGRVEKYRLESKL
jgi:tetratricopeptide (TPR) repeat protein